ncbi:hypothetical protein K443DRAFT_679733 [Laccaria amethystina LaAM-08-1]|uniref:Pre-rRNA processing protein n=1 Tax=Laccaria amethystina LaAM-08-1 TaxID=1095629 RepID=A0A0C9XDP0_9AGAR|nr:hypothetical protein K443DRAFT_679733 [Laccaria amethystina LaAM-08-1]
MSNDDLLERVDKGKARAQEPTERTPLIGGTSQPPLVLDSDDEEHHTTINRRLRARLTAVFFVTFSFCIIALALFALLAWTYAARASRLTPEDIIKNDLVYQGPSRVDVLNISSDGGVWVRVEGKLGVDAGAAIGVNSDAEDGILKDLWKMFGRHGVRALGKVSVNMSTMTITPQYDTSIVLLTVQIPPLEVPLTVDPPRDFSWLTTVSTPVFLQPTTNTTLLLRFLKDSWQHGSFNVRADIGNATVRGGGLREETWRSNFHSRLSNVRTYIRMKMPKIPGFPQPGKSTPFPSVEDVVTLQHLNVSSSQDSLSLHAKATMVDPAPEWFNLTSPSLPFTVFLATDESPLPIAAVNTQPITLTHPNITLLIDGTVLPLSPPSFRILSQFLTRYLSGESNGIIISSGTFPGLSVETTFPGPHPKPHILRNVTIRDMKIKPSGTSFLASGTVQARVVLPKGIHVGLDVYRVLPDVLIFDGEVPEGALAVPPPVTPLPDPLPERAFGHLRPKDWLPSISVPDISEDGEGAAYAVSAKVVDLPLEVLPGRQKEFNHFVSKVIFGTDGAVAGIQGSAGVTVAVRGLPLGGGPGTATGQIDLFGLPFQGSVRVGKKGLFKVGWEGVLERLGMS